MNYNDSLYFCALYNEVNAFIYLHSHAMPPTYAQDSAVKSHFLGFLIHVSVYLIRSTLLKAQSKILNCLRFYYENV
jgi:hypothetical protein